MRFYLVSGLAAASALAATMLVTSEKGLAQSAGTSGPGCSQAIEFVRQQAEAGVDLLGIYEKDEIEWAAKVELSGTSSCPAIPANLLARYRGDAPPNMAHKRMNCHLAVDALYTRYGNDIDSMPNQSADFFYEYVEAVEKGKSCPAVPAETHLLAKGHELSAVDNMYLTAAENGDSDAVLEVALRRIRSGDRQTGFDNLAYASSLGNPWADLEISELYRAGVGVEVNPAESHYYMLKAANSGLNWAMVGAGRNFETGYGVKKDPAQAIEWYRKAAEQGHIAALPLAAVLIAEGRGVKKDRERAYELLRIATSAGEPSAMFILGALLLSRNDGEVAEEGLAWLDKAIDRGNPATLKWADANLDKVKRHFEGLSERQKERREAIRLGKNKRCTNTVNYCVNYVSTSNYSSQRICNSGIDYWNC